MADEAISPLTGRLTPAEQGHDKPWSVAFRHEADGFDDLLLMGSLISRIGQNKPQYAYEEWKTEGR